MFRYSVTSPSVVGYIIQVYQGPPHVRYQLILPSQDMVEVLDLGGRSMAEPGPVCCSAHFCCQLLSGRSDHHAHHSLLGTNMVGFTGRSADCLNLTQVGYARQKIASRYTQWDTLSYHSRPTMNTTIRICQSLKLDCLVLVLWPLTGTQPEGTASRHIE